MPKNPMDAVDKLLDDLLTLRAELAFCDDPEHREEIEKQITSKQGSISLLRMKVKKAAQ